MAETPDVLLELFAGKSKVSMQIANYRGLSELRCLVEYEGGRVPAHSVTAYRPEINERVWVAVIDGVPYMLGPTIPKPASGEVVSSGSGVVVVSTDVGEITATHNSGETFADGAIVKLAWSEGAHIIGTLSSPVVPEEVPPAPGQGGRLVDVEFTSIDSGSYQGGFGWRIDDVWSSASNYGAWFYGTKIRDTIPPTATIVKAEIYLPRPDRLLGARPFGRHPHATKPGGAPSISATTTLPDASGWRNPPGNPGNGTEGWVPIPTSLIDHLKTNVGGLGFDLGGWNVWAGRQRDGQSGTIRVTYET